MFEKYGSRNCSCRVNNKITRTKIIIVMDERKYEDALERAKELLDNMDKGDYFASKADIESIFPELKENKNEDERIRKAIIAYISYGQHCGVSNKDMVAWLENQNKTVNVRLLPEVLGKHLYTCVNKTNHYVRSEEDHITLIEFINKIIDDLNIK